MGLKEYAFGKPGDENVVTASEGAVSTDQRSIRIVVRTRVKTQADDTSVSQTITKSTVAGTAYGVKIVSTSTNYATRP